MRPAFLFFFTAVLSMSPALAMADDVYVEGYHRDDGTYVRPHVRSSPDSSISNNYGPSQNDSELMNPRTRDYDDDGVSNYQDYDSDNDGFGDELDDNPYGSDDSYGFD